MKLRHYLITGAAVASLALTSSITFARSTQFTPTQTKDIEKIVHDYLVKNPNILIEVSHALRQKQETDAENKAKVAIRQNVKPIFSSVTSPTYGNKDGKVTLVEFLDYQCGHCKTMSQTVTDIMKADPNVRFVVKQLPIFGKESTFAAKAVIAAFKINPQKSMDFHNALLNSKGKLNEKNVLDTAKKFGYDIPTLQKGMTSKAVQKEVADTFELAKKIGLMGTPAFIVGNRTGSKTEYVPGGTTKDNLMTLIKKVTSNG